MRPAQQRVLHAAAKTVLHQKLNILKTVTQQHYTHSLTPLFNASVGGHIRHSLDHYSALLSHDYTAGAHAHASDSVVPVIDYDVRDRQTDIETNKASAVVRTNELLQRLDDLFSTTCAEDLLATPLSVRFVGDSLSGDTYCVPTTLGREVSFVAHHGIHHLGKFY
jgi:hypothetical protein